MPHKRGKRSAREELRKQRGSDLAPEKQSLSNEAIPKSAARVLNAAKIREEWKSTKRQLDSDDGVRGKKRRKVDSTSDGNTTRSSSGKKQEKARLSQFKIQPGEPIQHFNRRVEDDMRPIVKSAIQASRATVRQSFRAETEARKNAKASKQSTNRPSSPSPPPTSENELPNRNSSLSLAMAGSKSKIPDQPKDFEKLSTSAPRRLNDIAQAPPTLTALPRGAKKLLQQNSDFAKRSGVLSMAQKSMIEKEREKIIQKYRLIKANRRKLQAAEGRVEDDAGDLGIVVDEVG
ncbi:hypothetical protein AX17_003702 [Amanita inopinata Kibby_2008]|nr:hypothetical protein AX17_003702 [Amanita inopinata Kibby_2008]